MSTLSAAAPSTGVDQSLLTCPVCDSDTVAPVAEIHGMPVLCNILLPTREAARNVPRGDINLSFCTSCGHVFNTAFEPARMDYTEEYDNSLHFSARFQEFVENLADRLIETYDLHQKQVVEIGCGKGDFLRLLCERGPNEGVGFDPSYEPELLEENVSSLFTVVQDLYSERYASHDADLVCCRHVLEHVPQPRAFIETVRRAVGLRTDTALYFEVPNVLHTFRDLAIWDLIYEHYSYFSPSSLAYLFNECGFSVERMEEIYGRQFIGIDARPRASDGSSYARLPEGVLHLARHVESFITRFEVKKSEWRAMIDGFAARSETAVVWGAGSKGVTILNMLGVTNEIRYVVDINPRKQGKHIAGTGQEIIAPERLGEIRPDAVIVVNPIYSAEIRQTLDGLGLASRLVEA